MKLYATSLLSLTLNAHSSAYFVHFADGKNKNKTQINVDFSTEFECAGRPPIDGPLREESPASRKL